jgi:hypothetical protein
MSGKHHNLIVLVSTQCSSAVDTSSTTDYITRKNSEHTISQERRDVLQQLATENHFGVFCLRSRLHHTVMQHVFCFGIYRNPHNFAKPLVVHMLWLPGSKLLAKQAELLVVLAAANVKSSSI